jgi:hypothetical protein
MNKILLLRRTLGQVRLQVLIMRGQILESRAQKRDAYRLTKKFWKKARERR